MIPSMSKDGLEPCGSAPSLAGEENADSIRVYVRVRPPTEREEAQGNQSVVQVDTATSSLLLRGDRDNRNFTFDGVMGEDSTQEEVFDLVGRSVGTSCLSGYNGSVYVYGQTGVGKTYTMSGPVTSVQSMQFDERRGLICRVLDCVFAEVQRLRAESDGITYLCRCSFLEIYKEQITDLLEPTNSGLQVREDSNRGVYVDRLSEPTVCSLTDAFQVLWRGLQHRHIGSTHMNERSSRSHAVFTLAVETARTRAGVTSTRVARLSLVDLAGSERQQGVDSGFVDTSPHQSLRVREAGAINKSLSALTNVVMSLSREEKSRRRSSVTSESGRRGFVHYRDSKLTFLLRDSLGGNSKTVIVANISPSALCSPETLSTLKFAARAKHIRNAAVRNEEFSGTVESLMHEVKALRRRLSDVGGPSFGGGLGASPMSSPRTDDDDDYNAGQRQDLAGGGNVLHSRKRIRRLEVLLAAALERERIADQRRHQLHRLAGFLEDLDFRKSQSLRKLHSDYNEHISQVEQSAVSDDKEVIDLTSKLKAFDNLLGNLITGDRVTTTHTVVPLNFGVGSGQYVATAAPGGTAEEIHTSGPPWIDAGTGGGFNAPGGSLVGEADFLREENLRLRQQLEQHPEVSRLAAENKALRVRLDALNLGTNTGADISKAWGFSEGGVGGTSDVPAVSPLSSDMMLQCVEAEDDDALQTWVYFQKMAKEVEELLRAKDSLDGLVRQAQEDDGVGLDQRLFGSERVRSESTDDAMARVVEPLIIEEITQTTQDALQLATGIIESQRPSGPTSSPQRLGAKEVDGRRPVVATDLGRNRSPSGQDPISAAFSPRLGFEGTGERSQIKQALQKVKDLHGTLDLANSTYNEAYDEFQQLREDYENRLEECQFFELECSKLDMHCHGLTERLHGTGVSVRAGMGSFSVAGLSPTQAKSQQAKRSFSLSSLRDQNFWEQRFEELSFLTGIEESEPSSTVATPAVVGQTTLQERLMTGLTAPRSPVRVSGQPQAIRSPVARLGQQPQHSPKSSNAAAALEHSMSLSSLCSDDGRKPPQASAYVSQSWEYAQAVRRVASAPLLPSFGDLRVTSSMATSSHLASQKGSPSSVAMAPRDEAPPSPAVRTTFEPAKLLAVTRSQPSVPLPTGGDAKAVQGLGVYMRQSSNIVLTAPSVTGAVPAMGSTSMLTTSLASAASDASLNGVATAPLGSSSLASQDLRNDVLIHRGTQASTSSGFGGQSAVSRNDHHHIVVANESSVHQSSSGSISARAMLGRSVGVPSVNSGNTGAVSLPGARSITVGAVVAKTAAALSAAAPQTTYSGASLGNNSIATAATSMRPAPASARAAPQQSQQRPTSRGVGTRARYVAGTAATARGPLAFTPQQRYGV